MSGLLDEAALTDNEQLIAMQRTLCSRIGFGLCEETYTQQGVSTVSETEDGRVALESVLAFISGRSPRTWTDADTDRFQDQAKMLGRSFQAEREGTAFEVSLSPKQREDSRQVAEDIRKYIQKSFAEDPKVLKAAFQALLNDFNKKSDQ